MNRSALYGIGLVCCALVTSGVEAAPHDFIGLSVDRQSTAGGTVVSPTNGSDVVANPALISSGKSRVSVGVTTLFDRSRILLMPRPRGYDPSDYDLRIQPRKDSHGVRKTFFVVSGKFDLIPNRIQGALVAALPVGGIARIDSQFSNETEQYFDNQLHFARFDRRMTSEVFGGGLSYRFTETVSFGVGVLVLPVVNSRNDVYTPNAVEPGRAEVNLDTQNSLETGLTVGVHYKPRNFVSLGLAFRNEMASRVTGENVIQLRGAETDGPFEQSFQVVPDFVPWKLSLALRGELAQGSFLEVGTDYVGWSGALNEHGQSMEMDDVIEATVGVGLSFDNKQNELRFGVGWRPSPTPSQSGRTNHVDNDRFIVSGGGGHRIKWGAQHLRIGVAVQLHLLLPEQTLKKPPMQLESCETQTTALCDENLNEGGLQTGNPGFPGYGHGGHMVTVGVDMEWIFDE